MSYKCTEHKLTCSGFANGVVKEASIIFVDGPFPRVEISNNGDGHIHALLADTVVVDLTEMFGKGNEPTDNTSFLKWVEEAKGGPIQYGA